MTDLPSGWAWATLDDVKAAEDRSITDGPFGSNLTSAHYTTDGARVIRLQNIGDGIFRDDRTYISMEHYEDLKAHEVIEGDLILASLGAELPRGCILPRLNDPAIVKADCIRVRAHRNIEPKWLLYTLSAPQSRRNAASLVRGIGRPRLGLRGLRSIPIPIPPLAEQRRTVAVLEVLFSHLDRASDRLSNGGRRAGRLITSIRDAEITTTNSAWRWGTLSDVLDDIEAGKSFNCEARQAGPDEWGIIKVSAMTWGEFRQSENKAIPSTQDADPRVEIHPGDVLLSRANTIEYVGASVLVRETRPKLLLSDKSLRLVPAAGIDKEWLVQVLSSSAVRRQISERATGTKESMRNISQADLLRTQILIPPVEQQPDVASRVTEKLTAIRQATTTVERGQRHARLLRHALLRDAFAGRLVAQDPDDQPARVLLEEMRAERELRIDRARRARSIGLGVRAVRSELELE